jgi:hypothetical protein
VRAPKPVIWNVRLVEKALAMHGLYHVVEVRHHVRSVLFFKFKPED